MHKILKKISAVVQIVLLAPVKLPGKALNIIKYVALGLGVLEAVVEKEVSELSSDQVNEDEEGPVSSSLREDQGEP